MEHSPEDFVKDVGLKQDFEEGFSYWKESVERQN